MSDTRERLLRITADELARGGYPALSLRRVAARAGIGPATVFHHFPGGKDALYGATIAYVVDELVAIAALADGAEEPAPSAEELILGRAARLWDFLADKPELAALLLHESFGPPEGSEAPEATLQAHAEAVVAVAVAFIEDAQAAGSFGRFDARRFLFWGALHVIGYHGAPAFARHLLRDGSATRERRAYLDTMRAWLRGEMPVSA